MQLWDSLKDSFTCVKVSLIMASLKFSHCLIDLLCLIWKEVTCSPECLPCCKPMSSGFDSWSCHLCAFGFQSKLAFAGFSLGTSVFLLLLTSETGTKWSKICLEGPLQNQSLTLSEATLSEYSLFFVCFYIGLFVWLFLLLMTGTSFQISSGM